MYKRQVIFCAAVASKPRPDAAATANKRRFKEPTSGDSLSACETTVGLDTALFVMVSASTARVTVQTPRRVRLAAGARRGAAETPGRAKLAEDIDLECCAQRALICVQESETAPTLWLHRAPRVAHKIK